MQSFALFQSKTTYFLVATTALVWLKWHCKKISISRGFSELDSLNLLF